MAGVGWRLRMFARRALPHTPAKRWAYGGALLACVVLVSLRQPLAAVGLFAVAMAVRVVDMRRARRRRAERPAERTYFFEGPGPTDVRGNRPPR